MNEEYKKYWHSTSHIMAQAVKELYPDVKLGIGPPIENGFYYDFDSPKSFTPEDLERIEKRMQEIINNDYKFIRKEIKKEEAIKFFQERGETYKLELIKDLGDTVTTYTQNDFTDLCQGPHVSSTGEIKAFKLLKVSGAYWKGDEKNPMLQRIYGISFPTKEELEDYLRKIEEAKERDHIKLSKQLELCSIFPEVGPGLVCWHPNAGIIRKIIEDFWKEEHIKRGYELVYTPHIAKAELWKTSGHYDYYEFITKLEFDSEEYILKPMNCVFHILIYKNKLRSYKELPIKYAELGTVYRCEKSGVLHGLIRVRSITQDDAHIFCTEEQIENELTNVLDLAEFMLKTFGFTEYKIELSIRDKKVKHKYIGEDEEWDMAEKILAKVLDDKKIEYKIAEGEAAFYGPKIDIQLLDALERKWQSTTIQFDFNLPKRFDITYIGKDNKPHYVIMIHRAILGALERFMGCLIEHYKGAFPLWLSPIQVVVATINEKVIDYGKKILDELVKSGIRAKKNFDNKKIEYKIREATINKIPYIIIIGEKEKNNNLVAVRERNKGDIGKFNLNEFINLLKEKIERKA